VDYCQDLYSSYAEIKECFCEMMKIRMARVCREKGGARLFMFIKGGDSNRQTRSELREA
jgi:hypothetical protein